MTLSDDHAVYVESLPHESTFDIIKLLLLHKNSDGKHPDEYNE